MYIIDDSSEMMRPKMLNGIGKAEKIYADNNNGRL